jgi:SAM-dependent methyltransferase
MATFSVGFPERGFTQQESNFRHVYLDPRLREQFFLFLENVFNLYPEDDLHGLIIEKVKTLNSDREIYQALLKEIPSIRPFLAEIRYALPSLRKQKEVMCTQTLELLDRRTRLNGYLEIGTTGRYYDHLSDSVRIDGPTIFVNSAAPTFGAADIVERGQVSKVGTFQPLNDYEPISPALVPDESLDLVTVYIGFHHAPAQRRLEFIRSCHRVLRRGGALIVRDHDVTSPDLVHFVALAHDVFNAGLELPWESNHSEVRNFLSISELERLLESVGFTKDERRLLQAGDPTHNTLMKFVRA